MVPLLFFIQKTLAGLALQLEEENIILYSAFNTMSSTKFCGSKAIDYCCSVSSSVCLTFNGLDLENSLRGYDQVLRRFVKSAARQDEAVAITFIVDTATCSDEDRVDCSALINRLLRKLWSEANSKVFLRMLSLRVNNCVEHSLPCTPIWPPSTALQLFGNLIFFIFILAYIANVF